MPKSQASAATPVARTVFVGGVVGLSDLSNSTNTSALLAAGNIGFYMQESAMEAALYNGSLSSIAAGITAFGQSETEINLQPKSQAAAWFKTVGSAIFGPLPPSEYNIIVNFSNSTWLTDFETTVQVADSYGATSVAPIFSPNSSQYNLDSFANDKAYASIRTAAQYGGGLTIDAPPAYFYSRGPQYQQFTYQEIQWAHQNGLRATVIISPYGDDANFLNDTEDFVKTLEANGATPSEWVVENYTPSDPNGVGSDTATNSIAGVALWVAQNAKSSTSSVPQTKIARSISLSAPGTVMESVIGGGVTVTETIHTTGLYFPLYVCAFNAGNSQEGHFQQVTLDANGNATFSIALQNSGDYVLAEDNGAAPTVIAKSAPVTITEPPATITISPPGTIQESEVGGGVNATVQISTTDIVKPIYVCGFSAGNAQEGHFQLVPLSSTGTATVTVHLAGSGDYVLAETSGNNPLVLTKSARLTITEPPATITISPPGTVQESAVGTGVNVTEQISTTDIVNPIYVCGFSAGNAQEGKFQVVPLNSTGTATVTVHLANSGDYVLAETSGNNPVVLTKSAPVTVTEPAATLTLSAPGTIQESAVGAGVSVTEQISTTNIAGPLYVCGFSAGNAQEGKFQVVPLNSTGTATVTVHLANSGDYVLAETSGNNPVVLTKSSPVFITDLKSTSTGSLSGHTTTPAGVNPPGTSSLGNASALSVALPVLSTDHTSTAASFSIGVSLTAGAYTSTQSATSVGMATDQLLYAAAKSTITLIGHLSQGS